MAETINDRIKKVRLALGLSQVKFCREIFLSPGHYAGIELYNREVNKRIIKLISVIYNVREEYLKTGKEPIFSKVPDLKLQKMVGIFQELPDEYKDYILQQIDQLKKLRIKTEKNKKNERKKTATASQQYAP
jgi:transcriptional regulator with XRE-family HTH domain